MAGKRRKAKTGPQPYRYYFKVLDWFVDCQSDYDWKVVRKQDPKVPRWDGFEIRESEYEHRHYLKVIVELLNPLKQVAGGDFDICTSRKLETRTAVYPKHIQYEKQPQEQGGGALWSHWDDEHQNRVTTGLTYVDECSFLALVQVLTSGRSVIVELGGEAYYRNSALIKRVGWFTEGDPDQEDELAWAIESAPG